MRYLVTGATGNVGAELLATLADAGHQVRALIRGSPPIDAVVGRYGAIDRPKRSGYPVCTRAWFVLPAFDAPFDKILAVNAMLF